LISRIEGVLGVRFSVRDLFEWPSVAGLVGLGRGGGVRSGVVRVVRPDVVPLSFAQRRLWFLNRLDGSGGTYNIPFVVRLLGELDLGALELALGDVVGRHESLRTVFPDVGGVPCQVVLGVDRVDVGLSVVGVGVGGLAAGLDEVAGEGFDLSVDVPFRVRLFGVGEGVHVLSVVIHHVAADGESVVPFLGDLLEAYRARCGGGVPGWSVLPVQYVDYALWQRELLGEEGDSGSVGGGQLEYWRGVLEGLPEELVLPFDRSRPVVASHRGGMVGFGLSAGVHGGLLDVARVGGASLFMVGQAGFAVLLSRLGAGSDIPLGSPVAGRGDEVLEGLVGFFVNTLVFRVDVSGDPSFREVVGRVRDVDLAGLEHQDLPFERLVEVLNPVRSMARHPLFQVLFTVQGDPRPVVELPGLRVEAEVVSRGVAKFDLSVGLVERFGVDGAPAGLDGFLEYASDLFDRGTAEGIAARFVRLLEAVAGDPDVRIGRLDVLSEDERHLLLTEW
ncbi:condensation domain-containing protein, partial [Streptomyces amakusaensis]